MNLDKSGPTLSNNINIIIANHKLSTGLSHLFPTKCGLTSFPWPWTPATRIVFTLQRLYTLPTTFDTSAVSPTVRHTSVCDVRIINHTYPLVYPSIGESTPCVLHGLSACQVMLLLDPCLHRSRRAPRFPQTPSLANFITRLRGLSDSWNQTSMCSYKTPVLR